MRKPRGPNIVWTQEEIALLRQLWPTGVSVAYIVSRVHKDSHAINSKANRLGLRRINFKRDKQSQVEASRAFEAIEKKE